MITTEANNLASTSGWNLNGYASQLALLTIDGDLICWTSERDYGIHIINVSNPSLRFHNKTYKSANHIDSLSVSSIVLIYTRSLPNHRHTREGGECL